MLEHGKYLKKFALIFSKHNMVKTLTIFECLEEMPASIFWWEIFNHY